MPKALITGISGQDGSYLTELLLDQDYEVHGIVRPAALENPEMRLAHLQPYLERIRLHAVELNSLNSTLRVLREIQPQECYHLASESYVSPGFENLREMMHANLYTTHNLLEALRQINNGCRIYFAASQRDVWRRPLFPPVGGDSLSAPHRPTACRNCRDSTSAGSTTTITGCTSPTASSTITNRRGGAPSSSPARFPRLWPGSKKAGPASSIWATSKPAGMGPCTGLYPGYVADGAAGTTG